MKRVLAISLVALSLSACSSPQADERSDIPASLKPTAPSSTGAEFKPCEEDSLAGLECATVKAPLDYEDPSLGTIDVAVARARATKETRGVLLVNPGGPGASGREFLPAALSMLSSSVTSQYDVIAVDPRGTGGTIPVDCGTDLDTVYALDPTPSTPETEKALVEADAAFAGDCEKAAGEYLPHITTVSSARDMDTVRVALGVEKLAYVGFSYGTELGAAYISLFPSHVGRFVLDGPVDVTLDPASRSLEQGAGFETALDEFFAWCMRSACRLSPDPEKRFNALSEKLDRTPLANPDRVATNQAVLLFATATALYSTDAYGMLAGALAAAEEGDGSKLLYLYDVYMERTPSGEYGSTQYAFRAISEADFTPLSVEEQRQLLADAKAKLPRFYPLFSTFPHVDPWPNFSRRPRAPFSAAPKGTTLVIAATKDPATPFTGGKALADLLGAPLLVRDGADHTSYSASPCVQDATDTFLLEGELPAEALRCD